MFRLNWMASNSSALILPAQSPAHADTNALEDIRAIKGPVHIPSSYAWLGWLLLVVAVAVAGWFLWKKLRQRKEAPKSAVSIPPHRRAKDRLRNANELLSDPYAYCSLVSDVVRDYLEERFDLNAPDRTTEEFLDEMRASQALHPDHKALLEGFLSRCDLVKFARFEPTQDELKSLLESALRLVEETAPLESSNSHAATIPAGK
jgi:hypothetical protein